MRNTTKLQTTIKMLLETKIVSESKQDFMNIFFDEEDKFIFIDENKKFIENLSVY